MPPTIRSLCEQAIVLVRGKRLILNTEELEKLNALDYEGLAYIHAQDEAVVCAMNFARVRDRLLQVYAWVFARKHKVYSSGESRVLPADFLTMLCVLKDGSPLEYSSGVPQEANEIIYTGRQDDVSTWPPLFCDVFCYSLAIEICPAVTGTAGYVQILEQKAQELIHRAQQIGLIHAETRLTLKEELYNRAIGLARGARTLKETGTAATEQGTDNAGFVNDRMTAEYQACVRASGSVRDRLLGLYAWRFARKRALLTKATSTIFGWKYAYELPEDCIKVLSLHSHSLPFDGEPEDYEEAGSVIYSNELTPEVSYTARIDEMSDWPGVFADVFCYNLAQEVALSTTGDANTLQLLEAKAQNVIKEAQRLGEIRADVKIPAGEELYNRAIALVRGQRIISPSGQASAEQGADFTGDVNYREREAMAVCRRSMPELRDKLLTLYAWKFARKSSAIFPLPNKKQAGWDYAYTKTGGCMRVLAVFSGDEPVEYEEADECILCNASENMTMRYTCAVNEISGMDAVFREVLCYELAEEISAALTWNAENIALLEQRKQALIQNAYRTGAISEETIIPLKDELIGRAVSLSYGTRTLSPTSDASTAQGADNAGMRDARYLAAIRAAKQSYEMVRRNLQEMYPWVFLRRNAVLTPAEAISGWRYGYVLPPDCLAVLNVIAGNEPVYYEEADGNVYCDGANAEVRYSVEVMSLKDCSPMFREVFCLRLAQEVITSTTNDINAWQALEQRAEQIIRHGYMTGQIQNETHISLKQEVYNRAISLSHGARTLKSTSESATTQGIDYGGLKNPRNIEEIRVCRQSSGSVRDKLLQLYPWVFARKSAELTPTGTISGWDNGYILPSDCLDVLTVLCDGEPADFEAVNDRVYCNGANASARYTARVEDMAKWSSGFVDVFCYELAEEIISATTGSNEQVVVLEQKKQALIADAYKTGAIKTETRIPVKQELYNRAIGLVKGLKTEKADVLDTRYEDEISACRRGYNSIRDRLLQSYAWVFARKTEIPAQLSANVPGWRYTYLLPSDCLKVNAVIGQDRRASMPGSDCECVNISEYPDAVELANWETAGHELYANRDVVYVRYTACVEDYREWCAAFTEAFVLLLAIEVALNVVGDKNIVVILEQRLARVIEDAQASGLIREDTRLPVQRESERAGNVGRMYLDYSGIPTWPCGDRYGRRMCDEAGAGKFCER